MTIYKGTIAKQPVVRDKVIFSAIKTQDAERPTQLVLFKDKIEKEFVDLLANSNLGDQVTVIGKMQKNKLNNETEISVAQVHAGDYKQPIDKFAVDPETDYIIGGQTTYGIIELIERPNCLSYYTDGEMFWYNGDSIKTPCNL
jgi:hypothetical protein